MPRAISRYVLVTLFASLVAVPSVVRGDITRFDLSGTITDGTGAVLPGVTVSLANADTGFNRSTVTDGQGRYSFNAIPPTGKWTLSAELQGFAPQHREGLEFLANTKPEVNFELKVGSLQEAITVQAESPLVRTRESELSSILDARQVDALPTNGRNFLSLLQTSGSVVPPDDCFGKTRSFGPNVTSKFGRFWLGSLRNVRDGSKDIFLPHLPFAVRRRLELAPNRDSVRRAVAVASSGQSLSHS